MRAISSASAARNSAVEMRLPNRPSAMFAVTRWAVSTPISAPINRSSRLSSIASSSTRRGSSGVERPKIRPSKPGFASGAGSGTDARGTPTSGADITAPGSTAAPSEPPPVPVSSCGASSSGTSFSGAASATKASRPSPILSDDRNILSRSFFKNDIGVPLAVYGPRKTSGR